MVPKVVDNLLTPVPVSGSHIGFSTLRMEPCWMAMGQAAGAAAALAIDSQVKVKNVDSGRLQDVLLGQKATLMYYRDVTPDHPDFPMIQFMGLRGYLPEWSANLDKPVDQQTAEAWEKISGKRLTYQPGSTPRKELLSVLYRQLSNYDKK